MQIVNCGRVDVNAVFGGIKERVGIAVACPTVQGGNMNGRETSQVILSLANGLESSQNPMPRELQNEDALLRKIADSSRSSRSKTPWRSVSLGIGDDAALFQPKPGHQTMLTCDWFPEGTHFLPDKHPPDSVGWKCLARAVSDVAAMG